VYTDPTREHRDQGNSEKELRQKSANDASEEIYARSKFSICQVREKNAFVMSSP
jgi:hypothetical protein